MLFRSNTQFFECEYEEHSKNTKNKEFLNKPKSRISSINSIRSKKYAYEALESKSILKRRIRGIFLSFFKEHLRDCNLLLQINFSLLKTWNFIIYRGLNTSLEPKTCTHWHVYLLIFWDYITLFWLKKIYCFYNVNHYIYIHMLYIM